MAKKKSGYNFFDKLLVLFTVFVLIALLLGTIAGVSDPRKLILISYFGLAYPFSLLVAIILTAWWMFRKKWSIGILSLLCIALGYKTLHATFGFGGTEGGKEKKETSIRVMTYNVHSFKLFGEDNIVCFQEFYTRHKGSFNTIDSLKRLLNTKYYYFRPAMNNDYEAYGLAIFSKYPIQSKGEILFEGVGDNMSIYADVNIKGKTMRVYNVHFQSISFQPQDYTFIDELTKKTPGKVSASKRILRMLKYAFIKRSNQVDVMKKEMAQCETPYLIAGDFNDTPASYVVTQITSGMNNSFTEKGSGFGKTYNGKFPNFQIDYIATTKDLDIQNYQITKALLSDHFPVRVDIKFKSPNL